MGKLRIVEGGIRVEGKTEFLKALYASKIRSTQVSWARKFITGLHILQNNETRQA